jgi:hypothetical protein
MTNRREFLRIGITASALPFANQAARAAGVGAGEPVRLYKVLYDRRIPASVAFARRAASLGVPTHAMEGDMTRFWYDDLYYRWRDAPAAIAGLTAHGPLFCLERLAWDQKMRVVFRGEHRPVDGGWVRHELSGPEPMLRDAEAAVHARSWSARLADVVTRCPRGASEIGAATASTRAVLEMPADADSVFCWVIAPAAKA